jgi:peptidoglycan/xylan/chitin deacetylase (PgdA/CDA1 family)
VSKKELLTKWLEKAGTASFLEKLPRRAQLVVLNMHRIGDAAASQYDPSVFSSSVDDFDQQVNFLKKSYELLSPDDAMNLIHGKVSTKDTCVLITFDDGYRDCLDLALPVLNRHNAKAVFFIVSQYAEHQPTPWWDQVAFQAKQARGKSIVLNYPHKIEISFRENHFDRGLKQLLDLYKSPATLDAAKFMDELTQSVGAPQKSHNERLLLNWNEAKLMRSEGMEIGLHSNSHDVMSKLTEVDQLNDIKSGLELMQQRMGFSPRMFAYPDGKASSFTDGTSQIVKSLGFEVAFSFYGGCNRLPASNPHNILRTSFSPYGSLSRVRLGMALRATTGNSML